VIVEHAVKREIDPGHWVPVRPQRGSLIANRAARTRCTRLGHCPHPGNRLDPSYCCRCGRARHLLDRLLGR
jgi:hypothetical protein